MADLCNMTRKTRNRQTRIHAALQSGYCAICHIPYNSLDDHIHSKKHLKLIGEDANYISINGFIDQHNLEPFLNLNGIDSIDINGRQIEKEFCSRSTRNAKNRAMSLERNGPSPIDSPIHHHLRSRKHINYAMSPSIDEDSFSSDKPEIQKIQIKEKKSNCKSSLTKVQDTPEIINNSNIEVWNSGRPKRRSCIRTKRASADERLVVDNRTYYKVEVMTNKLRSSSHVREHVEIKPTCNIQENEKDDKGLIVKFKKMRNSELMILNNEAENFLFPKKEDSSSSDEEDIDASGANTTVSTCATANESFLPSSDNEDYKTRDSFKIEDEGSLDSTTSSGRRRKKRRTHAEAFIMDNQKYYKFETPGSRLRYHGSLFPEVGLKSPKRNGEHLPKEGKQEVIETPETNNGLNLDNYKFSFETIPTGEKWYSPFRRQDLGEESYMYLPDDSSENPFILPYQIGSIPSLDPKVCITQYAQLKKMIQENSSASGSRTSCSTPEPSEINYTPSLDHEATDEDSKGSEPSNSTELCSENSNLEEAKLVDSKKTFRKGKMPLGKNPRKSPRQHASTLAILSSLIQQRKKRSKIDDPSSSTSVIVQKVNVLPPIPEEVPNKSSRLHYEEILHNVHKDWDIMTLDDVDVQPDERIDFLHRLDILDVLKIYDEVKTRGDFKNNRRFINGTPGRKPGRRKMNKTGWPNRKKGLVRKDQGTKEESSSSGSLHESEEELSKTDSIKDVNTLGRKEIINGNCDLNRVQVKQNLKIKKKVCKVKLKNVKQNVRLQPFVKVKKLDSDCVVKKTDSGILSPKRNNKRRMPASPKSPRMLRKPRGKWYKER